MSSEKAVAASLLASCVLTTRSAQPTRGSVDQVGTSSSGTVERRTRPRVRASNFAFRALPTATRGIEYSIFLSKLLSAASVLSGMARSRLRALSIEPSPSSSTLYSGFVDFRSPVSVIPRRVSNPVGQAHARPFHMFLWTLSFGHPMLERLSFCRSGQ